MAEMLVIGGGLLGREVVRVARDRFDTALTYNSKPLEIEGCTSFKMNIIEDVGLIGSLSPEYIVLTAAMTNVDGCEIDREGAWETNALGPKNVAAAARDVGARLIYISTDYVFDGLQGMYSEEDPVSPINYYGESKLAGERFVQEICQDCTIARTSVLYGWNPVRQNFITWAINEMRKGNRVNIVTDQYNTPTLASNLADQLMGILDERGIFHTSGSERVSRYELTVKAAKAFGLDECLINLISSDMLNWKAKRPMDSSLDVSKVSRFAKPLSVDEGLRVMAESEMKVIE